MSTEITTAVPHGKIIGEPNKVYHGRDCVSHSRLEIFRQRPELYRRTFIERTIQRDETDAMLIGSATHALVLEGRLAFTEQYAIAPECDRRTKEGKATFAAFKASAGEKDVLTLEQVKSVQQINAGVLANQTARSFLEADGVKSEVTWRGKPTGLPFVCQCRTDLFNEKGHELTGGRPYVFDLKTVDTSKHGGDLAKAFQSACRYRGYHRQCGFYLPLLQGLGVDNPAFVFGAVEKSEPFACEVFVLSEDKLALGLNQTERDLQALAQCVTTGVWPNGREGINQIDWTEFN